MTFSIHIKIIVHTNRPLCHLKNLAQSVLLCYSSRAETPHLDLDSLTNTNHFIFFFQIRLISGLASDAAWMIVLHFIQRLCHLNVPDVSIMCWRRQTRQGQKILWMKQAWRKTRLMEPVRGKKNKVKSLYFFHFDIIVSAPNCSI